MKIEEVEIPDETFNEVRNLLIEKARVHGMFYYSELSKLITTDRVPHHSPKMSQILGAISTYEALNDRPLLSVIVISICGNDIAPSHGFKPIADRFRKYTNFDDLVTKEMKSAHAFWMDDGNYNDNRDVA